MLGGVLGCDAMQMNARFRGYLPVVLDLETGGFDRHQHAILEIAVRTLELVDGQLVIGSRYCWAVTPHPNTSVEAASLQITGIDLAAGREAVNEDVALRELFRVVRAEMKRQRCQRAIVTAHNAHFDHGFLHAAAARSGVKRNPFHPFSVMDTVGLAGVAYGHTVLSEACRRAGIAYDAERAHSAAYDAEVTALLFCAVVNANWTGLDG